MGHLKLNFKSVLGFAFDFQPLNAENEMDINIKREDMMNNSNFTNQNIQDNLNNQNNQQPLVKLSLKNDDFKKKELMNHKQFHLKILEQIIININAQMQPNNFAGNNELDQLTNDTINLMNNLKFDSKKVDEQQNQLSKMKPINLKIK